ncbi:MAG: sugar-binding transcriptional regulator [Arachnia sp.]
MLERNNEVLLRVASMYHVQGETMDSIAHQLAVSRSTVSRLLKEARDRGVVRISVVDPDRPTSRMAEILADTFGVQAHLVAVRPGASSVFRLEQVARVAARILDDAIGDGDVVGIAWGTTTSAVAAQLRPRDLTGVTIVGLNGGGNHHTTGVPYVGSILQRFAQAFHGEEMLLPLPAFFDRAETRHAMWAERSTQNVLQVRASTRIAVFGVGGFHSETQSHVYSANYLSDQDRRELAANRVVGDVCTVMLREDGTWRDIAFNDRATGMTPDELTSLERRICVVSGVTKAVPLLAALRAGVATDLVLDEETARVVLTRLRPSLRLD